MRNKTAHADCLKRGQGTRGLEMTFLVVIKERLWLKAFF